MRILRGQSLFFIFLLLETVLSLQPTVSIYLAKNTKYQEVSAAFLWCVQWQVNQKGSCSNTWQLHLFTCDVMVSSQLSGLLKILSLMFGIRARFVVCGTFWSNQLSPISVIMKTHFYDQSVPQLSKEERRHETFRVPIRIVMEPLWFDRLMTTHSAATTLQTHQHHNRSITTRLQLMQSHTRTTMNHQL